MADKRPGSRESPLPSKRQLIQTKETSLGDILLHNSGIHAKLTAFLSLSDLSRFGAVCTLARSFVNHRDKLRLGLAGRLGISRADISHPRFLDVCSRLSGTESGQKLLPLTLTQTIPFESDADDYDMVGVNNGDVATTDLSTYGYGTHDLGQTSDQTLIWLLFDRERNLKKEWPLFKSWKMLENGDSSAYHSGISQHEDHYLVLIHPVQHGPGMELCFYHNGKLVKKFPLQPLFENLAYFSVQLGALSATKFVVAILMPNESGRKRVDILHLTFDSISPLFSYDVPEDQWLITKPGGRPLAITQTSHEIRFSALAIGKSEEKRTLLTIAVDKTDIEASVFEVSLELPPQLKPGTEYMKPRRQYALIGLGSRFLAIIVQPDLPKAYIASLRAADMSVEEAIHPCSFVLLEEGKESWAPVSAFVLPKLPQDDGLEVYRAGKIRADLLENGVRVKDFIYEGNWFIFNRHYYDAPALDN